jgi:hypothetical protein
MLFDRVGLKTKCRHQQQPQASGRWCIYHHQVVWQNSQKLAKSWQPYANNPQIWWGWKSMRDSLLRATPRPVWPLSIGVQESLLPMCHAVELCKGPTRSEERKFEWIHDGVATSGGAGAGALGSIKVRDSASLWRKCLINLYYKLYYKFYHKKCTIIL